MGIIISAFLQALSGPSQSDNYYNQSDPSQSNNCNYSHQQSNSQSQSQSQSHSHSQYQDHSQSLSQHYSQSQLEAYASSKKEPAEPGKESNNEIEMMPKSPPISMSQTTENQTNFLPDPQPEPEPEPEPQQIIKRKSKPELLLIVHKPTPTAFQSTSQYLNPINSAVIHEFIWKYGGKSVQLAGTFTDWKPSIYMVPIDPKLEYWRALVELDPRIPWEFKFVVDGVWRCSLDLPTVIDSHNNTNNILYSVSDPRYNKNNQ